MNGEEIQQFGKIGLKKWTLSEKYIPLTYYSVDM